MAVSAAVPAFAQAAPESPAPVFTKEEQAYIASCGVIRVGLNMARPPFAEYDTDTEIFTGINVDVMDEISRITGLTFGYVPMTAGQKPPELIDSGKYDVICGIERDNFQNSDTIIATHAFLESAIVPVGRAGEDIDLTGQLTVTFPSSFQALEKT